MRNTRSAVLLRATIVLVQLAVYPTEPETVYAQIKQEPAKEETKDPKKSSPGFEQDQSAMCISASQQAKLIASIVDSYSRRLGICAASNLSFKDDCSTDFVRLRQSFNQYQLALASVRNYCR